MKVASVRAMSSRFGHLQTSCGEAAMSAKI
jgi:hypothetical protein